MGGINTPFDRAFLGQGMPPSQVPPTVTSAPVAMGPMLATNPVGRAAGVPHYVPPPAPAPPPGIVGPRAGGNPVTGGPSAPQPNPGSGLMSGLAAMFGGGAPKPAASPTNTPANPPAGGTNAGPFTYTSGLPDPSAIAAEHQMDVNSRLAAMPAGAGGAVPGLPVTPQLPQDPNAGKIRFVDANTPRYAPPPGAQPAGGAGAGPAGGAAPPVTLQQARVLASFLQPRQQPLEAAQSQLLQVTTDQHNAALALAHAIAGKNADEIARAKAANDFLNGDATQRHIEMLRSIVNPGVGTAVGTTHLGLADPSQ